MYENLSKWSEIDIVSINVIATSLRKNDVSQNISFLASPFSPIRIPCAKLQQGKKQIVAPHLARGLAASSFPPPPDRPGSQS